MKGRILGIDYGERRIGVAVSDPSATIARSLAVVPNDDKTVGVLAQIVRDNDICRVVVGMPLTLRGEKGKKAMEVDGFINQLRNGLGVEVIAWDERFTSRVARQTLIAMGASKKQRRQKARIDEMSAALILQSFLDTNRPAS